MKRQRIFTILAAMMALVVILAMGGPVGAQTTVFINEIHYDNTGTDTGEAIEIAGPAGTDLSGWSLVRYNGNGGASYGTDNLSGPIPDSGNGFGFLVVNYPTNGLQNGSPDGVALVQDSTVVQFLSYEGSFTAADGPAVGQTSVDIGVSESSGTLLGDSLQLAGSGTTYEEFSWVGEAANTFGAVNNSQSLGGPIAPQLVINEVDYDQPSTDTAEYVEIKNVGASAASLDGVTLVLVNGTGGGASVYDTIDLPNESLAAGGYFVVCANAATVSNCDLDDSPDTNFIQNGAPDAAALRYDGEVLDAVSYEGNTGAPYTEGSGEGLADSSSVAGLSISRCADGNDTDQNNVDFVTVGSTPGVTNDCQVETADVLINEVDADNPSTDAAEFVELYDGGIGNSDLGGLVVVLYNGNGDTSYNAFDLDGQSTNADGYFVLCGDAANVANCDLDVSPDTNLIQNGADAVAVYVGDAIDFPGGTPVATTNLVDALVYDTDDADDAGLLVLLNAGQPQVNERDGGDGTRDSNQRCPNGSGGARNTDTYQQWVPTPGEENICEIVVPPLSCTDSSTITLIHDIQGSGGDSQLLGQVVVIDGVVVGDFQNNGQPDSGDLGGFFVQEEDYQADANPETSEGVFVFASSAADVMAGDHVRVRGEVGEFFGNTQLSHQAMAICETPAEMPAVTVVELPADMEQYEGMLATFPQSLNIAEFFNFDRFGEMVLTTDRQFQPTAVFEPGSQEAADLAAFNASHRITLDDGRTSSNPDPAIHPNGLEFTLDNRFRGGNLVTDATGVINYAFGLYRIQPTQGATYEVANERPAAPDTVGGRLKVASLNVLNYFTTLDESGNLCGPPGFEQGCRGADNQTEFDRQRAKIIAALLGLDADVIGLMEIENSGSDTALADLVAGMNEETEPGTYAYIATGYLGTDVITQAFIYKVASVTPKGAFAALDDKSFTDPRNTGDDKNRPALAQSFVENDGGAVFTVVVNHLKSKGSGCGPGDDDPEQGSCNLTRTLAVQTLVEWLGTDPTGSGDPDFAVIGDLNAYDKEDPIDVLAGADYTDLEALFGGELAYSYVFNGQLGYLDYALANASLLSQVTGATTWYINADEPDILDYDTSFKKDAQDALYEDNEYRSSDHDPVIMGLALNRPPVCSGAAPNIDTLWSPNHKMVDIEVLGVTDPDGDEFTINIDSIFQDEPVNGENDGNTSPDAGGVGTSVAQVRAERDGLGNGRFYHINFTATDVVGNTCSGTVMVSVPANEGDEGAAVDDGPLYDATADLP